MMQWILLNVVAPVLTAGVSAVLAKFWQWLDASKTGKTVDSALKLHQLVQEIAGHALDYVDEQALRAGIVLDTKARESQAVTRATQLAETLGLDKLAEDELRKIIVTRTAAGHGGP